MVKSRVKIRRYTPYRAIRFRNCAVRVAKKRNEKGNKCGKDDVEIAREARISH